MPAVLVVVALIQTLEAQEEPAYGGRVVIGVPGGMAPINPIITHSSVSVGIFFLVFDRFVTASSAGEIQPGIAESWHSSKDHLTWDFELRKDITFHDGHPLTANDVVYTFGLMQKYRSSERWGGIQQIAYESIAATSLFSVQIKFSQPPHASFLYRLREHVLPKHIIEAQLSEGVAIEDIAFNRGPIGSGPFKVASTEPNLELRAFEDYHDGRPYLDEVAVRAGYAESQTLWAGLMKGELDVATRVAPEDVESIAENPAFEVLAVFLPAFTGLWLNCSNESLLSERSLRQAIDQAVDRKAVWTLIGGPEDAADLAIATGPFLEKQRSQTQRLHHSGTQSGQTGSSKKPAGNEGKTTFA